MKFDDSHLQKYKKLIEGITTKELEGHKSIAVALSAGIDSAMILFCLLDLGYKVTAFTFHREGVISTDFKLSKENCKILGVDFVEVIVPNKIDTNRLIHIMRDLKVKNKSAVECTYTMDYVWEKMQEHNVDIAFSGIGNDSLYGSSKKANIHFGKTLELNQLFRRNNFMSTGTYQFNGQVKAWSNLCAEKGIKLSVPIWDRTIYDFLNPFTFKELNTPTQKTPCWNLYPDYVEKTTIKKHENLQCGDSQIRELFEPLLLDKVANPNNKKSMLAFWKDWQERLSANSKLESIIDLN